MKIIILGCGASYGIPNIKGGYGECDPNNPKNTRTRTALLFEDKDTKILFDTPPELREQLYKNHIDFVDAIVYTHMHADHTMGIDDAKVLSFKMNEEKSDFFSLPMYINKKDEKEFLHRFCFYTQPFSYLGYTNPPFKLHLIEEQKSFQIKNLTLFPIAQNHFSCESLGFQVGDFLYTTDLYDFINWNVSSFKDVKVWVLGCLTNQFTDKHVHLEKALQWFDIVKPEKMILTHLGGKMDYEKISSKLPKGVELAYDGMSFSL